MFFECLCVFSPLPVHACCACAFLTLLCSCPCVCCVKYHLPNFTTPYLTRAGAGRARPARGARGACGVNAGRCRFFSCHADQAILYVVSPACRHAPTSHVWAGTSDLTQDACVTELRVDGPAHQKATPLSYGVTVRRPRGGTFHPQLAVHREGARRHGRAGLRDGAR